MFLIDRIIIRKTISKSCYLYLALLKDQYGFDRAGFDADYSACL